jgi:hypothetical protein
VLFGNNGNSYVYSLCAVRYVCIYTYCAQYRDGGGANEIKILGGQCVPLAYEISLRAAGWPTLADSTSVEYQYSIYWFVDDVTKISIIQVAQSSGVVLVNGWVIREGAKGSSRELTYGFIQCMCGGNE